MRHAKRTDGNHALIRDGLRKLGFDVLDLSDVGGGVPDLCVRDASFRWPSFLEVKDPSKPPSARRLTDAEMTWFTYCGAITRVVLTLDEAVAAIEEIRASVRPIDPCQ